uniref:Nitrilase and fragile histidine triad fusion protein NitFhit n=1 Tax=Parascaris univalens TaxID=6257 RepID=A0A915BA71_PARUN
MFSIGYNIARRMASSQSSTRSLFAVCQMTATHDPEENFQTAFSMMHRAKERDAKMVFFPECFDFVGRTREESISMAVDEDCEYINRYKQCAKELGLWLSLGGFHQKDPKGVYKPYNTHLIIDDKGVVRGKYQKLHLFDLDIHERVRVMESEFSTGGHELVKPIWTPFGVMAMSICYDLRFSELALWNRRKGAQILTYPSAFTVNTGQAHWETLLRTRAIETQCYVVAAAQTGKHNDKRFSYGHAMVVDPWGAVIAQCSETVGMCFAEISLEYLNKVRTTQPIFAHRRSDLYSIITNEKTPIGDEPFLFGEHSIESSVVFYRSEYSFAFVNRSPVLPGHVLVSSIRKAEKLTDLTDEETADLFSVSKKVQAMIESQYDTKSSTVCVQDGRDAGQTIPHVHVHIVPRHQGDFGGNPDRFYDELAENDYINAKRPIRDQKDMSEEASIYRKLLGS